MTPEQIEYEMERLRKDEGFSIPYLQRKYKLSYEGAKDAYYKIILTFEEEDNEPDSA